MTSTTKELIAGFLQQEEDEFAQYLEERDIEPSEAGVIIDEFRAEI